MGYKGTFKCRRYVSKVKSGGIGIIYKEELDNFITEIKTESDFVAWYKIDRNSTGLAKDLLLGVIYIPPEGSKYTKAEAFEECELEFIDKLYNDSNGGISGMLNMFVLLYADDTVIMAENESDMQRNLDLLNEYCICNKLKVNISKTKMLVFARSKTRIRNIRTFKFGDMNLDQVEDYIYLGICFKGTCNHSIENALKSPQFPHNIHDRIL